MMKWLGRLWCLLNVLFMLWLVASWVDIIADNTMPNPVQSKYNAFVMLVEHTGKN